MAKDGAEMAARPATICAIGVGFLGQYARISSTWPARMAMPPYVSHESWARHYHRARARPVAGALSRPASCRQILHRRASSGYNPLAKWISVRRDGIAAMPLVMRPPRCCAWRGRRHHRCGRRRSCVPVEIIQRGQCGHRYRSQFLFMI